MSLLRFAYDFKYNYFELQEPLYCSARRIAGATKRPIEEIVQANLHHTLPPLDDVAADEAELLARMSTSDDASLWQEAKAVFQPEIRSEFQELLNDKRDGELKDSDKLRLRSHMDEYGRLLVRKSYAWLLLARRGYSVPVQQQ